MSQDSSIFTILRLYEAGSGTARAKAVGLLTYLLVEKCEHFRPNLKYLLFLPNYKDLDAVNASIRSIVGSILLNPQMHVISFSALMVHMSV